MSTPIISRTVAARLKLFGDRLLGPNADAAIIEGLTALRREGREPAVPFRVDERVLKPRVAGFLAVGGSLTSQWRGSGWSVRATPRVWRPASATRTPLTSSESGFGIGEQPADGR